MENKCYDRLIQWGEKFAAKQEALTGNWDNLPLVEKLELYVYISTKNDLGSKQHSSDYDYWEKLLTNHRPVQVTPPEFCELISVLPYPYTFHDNDYDQPTYTLRGISFYLYVGDTSDIKRQNLLY